MKTIRYYLSPQSPWTYFGHRRLTELATRHGARVELRPMDLGKVFPVTGGLPLPKRSPQRQAYRLREIERWGRHLGLPFNLHPKHFPVAGDPAARLIIATDRRYGTEPAMRLSGALMAAVWAEERDIADEATLRAVAREQGLDPEALLADAPQCQPEYERYTQEAIDEGVFGAPWYVVDGEGYWGQDRLDFVERALAAT